MFHVTVAATQMACSASEERNLARAEDLVRRAAGQGAQIILLQELFSGPYFCKDQRVEDLAMARTVDASPAVARMSALAAELSVVLPVSFFERACQAL